MRLEDYLPALAIAVAALIGYMGARFAATSTMKIGKETNAVTWAGQLLTRVESLEEDVSQLKKDLTKITRSFTVAVNYIEKFLQWAQDGSDPPIPDVPEALDEHLDPYLIRKHKIQQAHFNPEPPT